MKRVREIDIHHKDLSKKIDSKFDLIYIYIYISSFSSQNIIFLLLVALYEKSILINIVHLNVHLRILISNCSCLQLYVRGH